MSPSVCNIALTSNENDRADGASTRSGVPVPAKFCCRVYPGDGALVEGAIQ
jgi:hypothetical protein